MLVYVKEVLPVLKSCIWVCGGTRDGLSAGGKRSRTTGPSRVEYLCFDWFCQLEGWKKPVQKSPPS